MNPLLHPARLVPLGFLFAILVGTLLLMLPVSHAGPGHADWLTALFTTTSAVCVTGLATVDTATYWSPFGQVVIMGLFQIGGFGIMTGATLLGLMVSRRLSLSTRLIAQTEHAAELGDVRSTLKLVLGVTFAVELLVALVLGLTLHLRYGESGLLSAWHGAFLSESSFNNAGFSLYSDNLMSFVTDPWINFPIMAAILIGGIGFPVLLELWRSRDRDHTHWSVHTKLTLLGSAVLLVLGTVSILYYEWGNPATLGPLDPGGKLLASLFHSVSARTAGFNTLDMGHLTTETLSVHYLLMYVGGGSAGTAGGVKITTLALLAFMVWAEIRGEPDTTLFGRKVSLQVQRQALTVIFLSTTLIAFATLALLSVSEYPLEVVVFEAISAFATVGLSTGITAGLPPSGQLILIGLMFVGRVGTITVATALALRARRKPFHYPEENPTVG